MVLLNQIGDKRGGGMTMLILLGGIPLLVSLRGYFKDQWFSLWCQIRISLLSRPKRSLVDHRLVMYSLIILCPTVYLFTSSKLVGIGDGLSVRVSRSYLTSRLLSWTKIRVFQVSPQGSSLVRSSMVVNYGWI